MLLEERMEGGIRFDRSFRNYRSGAIQMSWYNAMGCVWWILYYWSVLLGGRGTMRNGEGSDYWLFLIARSMVSSRICFRLFGFVRNDSVNSDIIDLYYLEIYDDAGWKIVYVSSSILSSVLCRFCTWFPDFHGDIIDPYYLWDDEKWKYLIALFRLSWLSWYLYCCCLHLNVLYGFWWYYYAWNLW